MKYTIDGWGEDRGYRTNGLTFTGDDFAALEPGPVLIEQDDEPRAISVSDFRNGVRTGS